MSDKEDYLTCYRVFFEHFAATVNPEDQLPVNIAGYTITEVELPGEVLYWTTQYLTEKECPLTLMTPLLRIILDEVRVASKKQPNDFGYKADESVYIALRLMQAVTARVNDVCLRYLDNSRLDTLPPPTPLSQREPKTVSCATKNSRRAMEDRHVEIGNLEALFGIETTEPTSFYAVYDGHAGSAAATYCAAHLHQYLVESPHFSNDLRRAMRDAFLRTDAEFVRKKNQERACGGSTAVTVAVRGRKLVAAWAGDSLALLAKRMRLMQLVRPHKPGRQDERERIESSGGTVMYWGTWRVNGQLAVSRAIGDAQYKPYVTARPEIAIVDLDGDEDFVVVACDGLWDFVSEDDVALAVYRQLAADPDDLKAVTKRLIVQAKRQGSSDNISIIVVFLKEPRIIAAENTPPMDLGLDNTLANAPPFADETEACKRPLDGLDVPAMDRDECAETDNGVDNSDSDSEDLGPETAVDADDIDAERNHEPAQPTPPAHAVEEGHVDGALVDNVAESGEESEDEWNYFKGEGDRDELNVSEEHDEQLRSETPCQDNSAWESSSVDMNSSPLNPDAPVFVPGSVAGSDVLLAESPRKPLPMDDNELLDADQFEAGAETRPAEILDLDNSDQLNGHHNVSVEDAMKEHFNGNNTGFGFNVTVESDKVKDTSFIQDFERIQKDTTDFCDIQVYQAHSETNPFAADGNEDLFERLKNKERDPMSMSFYQEKDDDTCERLSKNDSHVDLNAVQTLPDSDDEDIQPNGICVNLNEVDKENINPEEETDLLETEIQEPNNDIIRFDDRQTEILANNVTNFEQGDDFIDNNVGSGNNVQNFVNIEFESSNMNDNILQTDTPESHKLLFEQIPEIPDGKSSELGFTNEDIQDVSESDRDTRPFTPQEDTSQDIEMESKFDDNPCAEMQPELTPELKDDLVEALHLADVDRFSSAIFQGNLKNNENEIIPDLTLDTHSTFPSGYLSKSPVPDEKPLDPISPEPAHDVQEDVIVDVHQNELHNQITEDKVEKIDDIPENYGLQAFDNRFDSEILAVENIDVPKSPMLMESPLPETSELLSKSRIPESPAPVETPEPSHLPVAHSPLPTQSPLAPSPLPTENLRKASPLPIEVPLPRESPLPSESPAPIESPLPVELLHINPSIVRDSPLPNEIRLPSESPLPVESQHLSMSQEICESIPIEMELQNKSPIPIESQRLIESPLPTNDNTRESPLPVEIQLPGESPLPTETQLPSESPLPVESQILNESALSAVSQISTESPLPVKSSFASESPLPVESHIKEIPLLEEPEIATKYSVLAESPLPADLLSSEVQIDSTTNVETETILRPDTASPLPAESPVLAEQPTSVVEICAPVDTTLPKETSEDVILSTDASNLGFEAQDIDVSPTPVNAITEPVCERLSPEVVEQSVDVTSQPENILDTTSGPTPDIVPEERAEQRSELVTDIDIGIPESRAQEICLPVTSEIKQEDAVEAATPPPTPAVDVPHAPETLNIPSLSETPIAADVDKSGVSAATAAVAAAAAGVGAAAAVAAAKTKKSPTTPTPKSSKPTVKSTTPRTPATKPATTPAKTPSRTPTAAKPTPTSAARPATKATTPITRAAPKSTPISKPATPASKAATPASKAATPAKVPTPISKPSQVKPISKPSAKPAPVKEAAVAAKTAPAAARAPVAARTTQLAAKAPTRPATAPAAKPAPKPAVPRSASAAARPAMKEATKPKTLEKKPIANGDVKAPVKAAPRPATTTTTAAAARPAPKPRVPLTAAASTKATSAAPKPAPRAAARTTLTTLDKQTKDLANKRITAKAAPPRTAPIKAPQGPKPVSAKPGAKKSTEAIKKPAQTNGLSNGSADAELSKPPPSPPLADNALLPDVIA